MMPEPELQRLYLIGMPGAGKTTLGRGLAVAYELPFLDLDEEIVRREGRSVADIFAAEGEDYFREREAAILREVQQQPGRFVLATGGGTPCFHHNLEALLADGPVLYLDVPAPELAARILAAAVQRPLLAGLPDREALISRLDETLRHRTRFYDRAPLRCSAAACTVENVRRLLGRYLSLA
ncbi:shikimate kinase [Hymenobacter canadensis]|uniref:Shikimate kinase n=1 Tax=Hymenobacter canadensis TaxID=2999067 RepID=A0ABY7LNT3_9BACT|nr:shikimate kinase [Hymenobacter canadensis]WBA40870.1 shikimate kinase [Hymenobacter canadensis]